ncbi:hypothetical protein ACNSOL_01340 [Aliarcobacter lanthieri]|uniref:hypothetical protein n=1 Tax=Aliarcobacter lanthieri TaxID=1355374 RepID=UPI003AAB55E0
MAEEVRLKIKIDAKSQELILMSQQVKELATNFNNADSFANTFLKRINLIGQGYIGFQTLKNTVGELVDKGMELNKTFQTLTNSLTMSSAVVMSNTNALGKQLSTQEKYALANVEATKSLELLQKASLNTSLSFEQNVKMYDTMYLGMQKTGASVEDMVYITEKLAIATGGKINFDQIIAGVDGLADGTVLANSDLGRFLKSIGLTNEAIKESSNVVDLFKSKLSGFQSLDSYSSKIAKLGNAKDTLAKNIMKLPFDYLESKIPTVTSLFNELAKVMNEVNIELSGASSLNSYDDLILKQYKLLGEISKVKNDKFMWDSTQKKKLEELNSELEIVFVKLGKIRQQDEDLKNTQRVVDLESYEKMIKESLDPASLKIDEINQKYLKAQKAFKEAKKDETELIKAWNKEISDLDKSSEKDIKSKEKNLDNLNKAYLDISQIGMNDYEKSLIVITEQTKSWLESGVSINDVLAAQVKLIDELSTKKVIDDSKEDLSYYERLVQLKSDSYEKELELANISYSQKALDIQGLNRPIEDKQKLLELETQIYKKTLERLGVENQINILDETSNSYQDILESQIDLINATNDWNSNLTGTAAGLNNIASATANLSKLNLTNLKAENKLNTEYEKNKLKYASDSKKLKELDLKYTKDKAFLDEKNISATLLGYSNIAGALSSMYDEGSKEAATFQTVQGALALVEGTRAVLTAGTGDPYTAIPRMIAMAATVQSLLGSIGIAFGMNKESQSWDSFSKMEANTGVGSILGDSSAKSESISNSLSILEEYAQPQFLVLNEMNTYVKSIENKISGLSSILIKNAGYALGQGFESFESGYKNKYSINSDIATAIFSGGAGLLLSKLNIPILSDITGLFGSVVNSVLGGLFGKTSVSQSLKDSGIYFADTLLTTAIKQFEGDAYQTIQTTVKKKSWFGSSSSTSINSYFEDLDKETNRQFTLVIDSLYKTVLTAGIALDSLESQTASNLANFVISLGKISLKDKTGNEIQEILTNVFGALGDNLAITAFPALEDFQAIGEGTFETLTRVATGMEEADYYISRLGNKFNDVIYTAIGNKQGNVGFEALLQSIKAVEVATYPVNNNLYKIVENLDVTAEELYTVYTSLDELRDRLIYLGQEAQGLSNNMIFGAGSITELENGFEAFFENFLSENEQLTYKTKQLIKEFDNLNIALPVSKDSFRELLDSLDLTTSSGQELYGRLIILSKEFSNVANSTQDTIDALQKSLEELTTNQFDSFIVSLDKVGASITNIKNTALSFLQGLSTSNNSNLDEQIISYNKMRAEFATYFDSEGVIKTGIDENSVNSLYSKISSMATNIAGKDNFLKDSLISQFENDIFKFDFADEIIKVNIVDGLGTLYNLTNEQLTQLQAVASDGKITNDELNSITGLTQTQKDGILSFANNSNFFSTEGTLSTLAEYSKLQLDAYRTQLAEETVGISKKTFTTGDYIGKQEQIDISKLLGISYQTAEPLIQNLQGISSLSNSQAISSLSSLLDYTGTTYNKTAYSQLELLKPYLGNNLSSALDYIKDTSSLNRVNETSKYQDEISNMNSSISSLYYKLNKENLSETLWANYQTILAMAKSFAQGGFDYGSGHGGEARAYSKLVTGEELPSSIRYGGGINYTQYEAKLKKDFENRVNNMNIPSDKILDVSSYYKSYPFSHWQMVVPNYSSTKEQQSYLDQIYKLQAEILQRNNSISSLNSFAVGSSRIEYDQLAHLHQGEIVAPKTFSDGIRNGELVMGDNNKVVEAINFLKDITVAQAREIQKMKEIFDEFNTRDLIKTAKEVA